MSEFNALTGNIHKFERKFVCTKRHLLDDYLKDNAKYMHSYKIHQKYIDNKKYRKYITKSSTICTLHKKEQIDIEHKKVIIEEIKEKDFDSVQTDFEIIKTRIAYSINNNLILDIDNFDNEITLIEVWSEDELSVKLFNPIKGLYEVTGNQFYSNEYIAKNTDNILSRGLYIIEGTDLIGKSTIVQKMIDKGYICMDRDQYNFSNYVDLNIPYKDSAISIINNYTNKKSKIVVLYTNNLDILKERLSKRIKEEKISEYDKLCCEYNDLYIKILNELKGKINIIGIDITNKSPNEIINTILGRYYEI